MKAKTVFDPQAQTRTEAQDAAQRALNDEALATQRYVSAILSGFTAFWGTPGNVEDRDALVAKLEALGADNWLALSSRHAAAMQYLLTNQMVEDVADWQLATPYEVAVDGSTITVGETLNAAWETESQ
jgi:hypothetical protein